MEVMIINGNRYLINTDASDEVQDMDCKRIMDQYPDDAVIVWEETPRPSDLELFSLDEIRMKGRLMATFDEYLN